MQRRPPAGFPGWLKVASFKELLVHILEGLTKTRHPAPAKQSAHAQAPRASLLPDLRNLSARVGESTSTREGGLALAPMRKPSAKKPSARRPPGAPRALPLRAISAFSGLSADEVETQWVRCPMKEPCMAILCIAAKGWQRKDSSQHLRHRYCQLCR